MAKQITPIKRGKIEVISLEATAAEITLLATLAADQLFRREFIDPKMPGYKSNDEELKLGKALVARLRSMVDRDPAKRTLPARTAG